MATRSIVECLETKAVRNLRILEDKATQTTANAWAESGWIICDEGPRAVQWEAGISEKGGHAENIQVAETDPMGSNKKDDKDALKSPEREARCQDPNGEYQDLPQTPPGGGGWATDQINDEYVETDTTTDETMGDISKEWCMIYGEMAGNEKTGR